MTLIDVLIRLASHLPGARPVGSSGAAGTLVIEGPRLPDRTPVRAGSRGN
jgi:hypothetical protein